MLQAKAGGTSLRQVIHEGAASMAFTGTHAVVQNL